MRIPTSLAPLARTALLGSLALGAFDTLAAFAQEAAAPAAEAAATTMDKGDTAWMMVSTILVLFMILPGLALFYGGLVRAKNMLSVLMQCTMITAIVIVIWVTWGYSFAFGGGTGPFTTHSTEKRERRALAQRRTQRSRTVSFSSAGTLS